MQLLISDSCVSQLCQSCSYHIDVHIATLAMQVRTHLSVHSIDGK